MPSYRNSRNVLVASIAVALLASCRSTPPGEINAKYKEIIDKRFENYQLQDGDTLSISFYDEEDADLTQSSALVLHDGRIDLYFLDHERVEGLTLPEFESKLRAAVKDQTAGRTPEVSVQVAPRGEEVILFGEFARGGTFPLTQMMTVRDAIAQAGGIRITGAPWGATLVRRYSNPTKPDVFTINLDEMSEEIVMLPGDTIELEKNAAAFVIQIVAEYVFGIIPSQFYSGSALAGGAL